LRILFDQGVPKPLQAHLSLHDVSRAYQLGWERKKNGELLALAENEGFEMLVTTDRRLRYKQNAVTIDFLDAFFLTFSN
jgi:hypothetical protein